jgi:hypothetical protein
MKARSFFYLKDTSFFVINNNKINCNLRTMQEAVTLKPNSKLKKKKVWGPRKFNFKAVGAITVFPKKSQI